MLIRSEIILNDKNGNKKLCEFKEQMEYRMLNGMQSNTKVKHKTGMKCNKIHKNLLSQIFQIFLFFNCFTHSYNYNRKIEEFKIFEKKTLKNYLNKRSSTFFQ